MFKLDEHLKKVKKSPNGLSKNLSFNDIKLDLEEQKIEIEKEKSPQEDSEDIHQKKS